MIDSGKGDQRTKAHTLVNTSAEARFGGDNVRQEKDDNEADRAGFLRRDVFLLSYSCVTHVFLLMEGSFVLFSQAQSSLIKLTGFRRNVLEAQSTPTILLK